MERSRSSPPGYDLVNPWWSQRLRDEVALRNKRPENLPVPFDEDLDGPGPEEARVESAGGGAGRVGKGRGVATGRLFVTPPSRRSEGRGGNRRSEGKLPEEQPSAEAARGHERDRTMGPVPPEGAPPRGPPMAAGAAVPPPQKGDPDSLQRAFEAEMVLFLREQNAKLQEEVDQLRSLRTTKDAAAAMSTPSSWETVDGGGGDGVPRSGLQVGNSAEPDGQVGPPCSGSGEPSMHTPRGRSPTTRRLHPSYEVRYTPNGTQIPVGPPPSMVDAPPVPPFPTSVSAEFSGDSAEMLRHYELFEAKRRGDSQCVPLSMREGRAFVPGTMEPRAERLEKEVTELKAALSRIQGSSGSSAEIPVAPQAIGVRSALECQGFVWGPDPVSSAGDSANPTDVWAAGHRERPTGSDPRDGGDKSYGRWRPDGGSAPPPLPWHEGAGNSKAELAELAADASPIELGDWLAVCGPVLRDISAVSARWWNLTLREAQCYYDRWKTSSPLERVQIAPRLPDELLDGCYQRTEQRGVNLLLRAIPSDQQQMLITDRELNSTALLFRLLVRYQPGGAGEKSILLSKLTTLDKAVGATDLAAALRSWRRHYARAQEIDAVLPDGTLLLRALEPACTLVASLDAQASFRLAQSRLQLAIDQQPIHQSIWRFSQCLLAEAETLSLMSSTPVVTTSPIKVKQMEAPAKSPPSTSTGGDKGKGGVTSSSTSTTPCRYFRSDAGCKAGRSCKWSHSWEGIEDKHARCWICGSKEHRKTDCKIKAHGHGKPGPSKEGKSQSEPSSSGGGKSSSKMSTSPSTSYNAAGGGGSATAPKLQEMEGPVDAASEVPAPSDGSKGETGTTSSEALLQEATKLLKSLRAPQLKVIKLSQLDAGAENMMVLLDSGATHALRPALTEGEWAAAQPTQVTLADGVTTKLRLKVNSKILVSDPADDTMSQSWIVPLGGITELGYRFEWKGGRCSLRDEQGQVLDVCIQHGCPMVTRQLGQEMIARLEHQQVRLVRKALLLKSMLVDSSAESLEAVKNSTEMALTLKMKMMFPDLPDEVLMKVIPDLSSLQVNEGHRIPWNRHKRRRLQQAKSIVIHLFSGPDHRFWEKKIAGSGI